MIAMQRHVDHWGSRKGKRALRADTLETERLVVVGVVAVVVVVSESALCVWTSTPHTCVTQLS